MLEKLCLRTLDRQVRSKVEDLFENLTIRTKVDVCIGTMIDALGRRTPVVLSNGKPSVILTYVVEFPNSFEIKPITLLYAEVGAVIYYHNRHQFRDTASFCYRLTDHPTDDIEFAVFMAETIMNSVESLSELI